MVAPTLLAIIRKNHEEIIKLWLDNCRGRIADEFEEMLETPMGLGVASSMYNLALEYLEAEEYETGAVLHRARESASNASFRRAAVGFSLADIVNTAIAFRSAMQETLQNRFHPRNPDEAQELLHCIMSLTRLGDALVAGEIAGFFTFSKFSDDDVAEAV